MRPGRGVLVLGLLSIVLLCGCQSEEARLVNGTRYESYVPTHSGVPGEAIQVDETNTITIKDVTVRSGNEGDCVIITYDWHNGSSSAQTLTENVRLTVEQGNLSLEPDLSLLTEVEKSRLVVLNGAGETLSGIMQGFRLKGTEPLRISISGNMLNVFVEGVPQPAWPVVVEVPYPA